MATAATGFQQSHDTWLAAFLDWEKHLANDCPWWLHGLRRMALARFAELGFPTTKVEEWKYTNLVPLAQTVFEPARGPARKPRLSAGWLDSLDAWFVRTVNGHPVTLPSHRLLKVRSLRRAWQEGPELLQQHFARYAAFDRHAFVALNTAFCDNGVLIEIAPGTVLERPVVVIHHLEPGERPLASHPRTLVLAGANSQAQIVEAWLGPDGQVYLSNSVSELLAGDGAVLDYVRLEMEGDQAFHFAAFHARQLRSSTLAVHTVLLGGSLVRSEIGVVLDGEGASTTLNGLYLAKGQQHMDNYTTLEHAQPHATSFELYKGILDGHSEGVFHGRIIVRPEAQKTDAIQRNKNLLLSQDAVVNTKPQLEIYADDVRCTHGATVGQVDADAVFYLRSRGVGHREARRLLTLAFAQEITGQVKPEALREPLAAELLARLDDPQVAAR
ncbi:MAG: Fe-S cluster assembly protein SufD [Bryobacteraceae bacterium]